MQLITDAIFLRFLERIFILIAALVTIRMGVKLLQENVGNQSNVQYSGLFGRFKITNAATGLVLAIFGIIILSIGLSKGLDIKQDNAPVEQQNQKALASLQSEVAALSKKDVITKKDLDDLHSKLKTEMQGENPRRGTSHNGSTEVKYSNPSAGVYQGPKIKLSTIQSLFKFITAFKSNPSAIDRDKLSELIDIYTEIYNFNKGDPAFSQYSPDKLKQ